MSTAEFVVVILAFCGDGKGNADMDCVDYYNNCVINKSIEMKMSDVKECSKNYKTGMVKLQERRKEFGL